MTPEENDRLLQHLLEDEAQANFRQLSLEKGLAFMRQRRRQRRAVSIGAVVLVPFMLTLSIWLNWGGAGRPDRFSKLSSSSPESRRVETAQVKVISDQELFALFPDRPLALIGRPGAQELVFLDQADRWEDISSR